MPKLLIRMHNAVIDEFKGVPTLTGIIDNESLPHLQIASYQREVLDGLKQDQLVATLTTGSRVPDVVLGVRGGSFTRIGPGTFVLSGTTYVIDGRQRRAAALEVIRQGNVPNLGALVHLNTTFASEEAEFNRINGLQTRLSKNVLLNNKRSINAHVDALVALTEDPTFELFERVCWGQRKGNGQLLNGTAFVVVAAGLHRHFGVNSLSYDALKVADSLNKLPIPLTAFQTNIRVLWQFVDQVWNIKDIQLKKLPPHMRRNYLEAFSAVLDEHEEFWNGVYLKIPLTMRKKFASFKLHDPTIEHLCGGGSNSTKYLHDLLLDHLKSGLRTSTLTPFSAAVPRRVTSLVVSDKPSGLANGKEWPLADGPWSRDMAQAQTQ